MAEQERPLGGLGHRWEDNITRDFVFGLCGKLWTGCFSLRIEISGVFL
jgi:hypothetical protein